MCVRAARLCAAAAILACVGAAHATDHHLPLRYNWNGLSQAGELNDPDAPDGFRSIADRALYIDAFTPNSLGFGTITGTTGITYDIMRDPGVLDIVHLGNTDVGTTRTWDPVIGNIANRGVIPAWLPATNEHTLPQESDVSGLAIILDANSSISFLYHVTNGGGNFQVTLAFTDSTSATVTLSANDWFGATNPPAAGSGVVSQTRLGGTTFTGTSNTDAPIIQTWPTQALAVTEAILTPQSILAGTGVNVIGKQLASVTFQNPNQPTRGYAIFASTVVAGLGPPGNDECANATQVFAGQTQASSARATGTMTSPCADGDTADVWFRYVAEDTGPLEVRTCGSSFDTTLAVYTACSGGIVACNDDGCGVSARSRWNATSGQTYYIRVAGTGGATGLFTLDIDTSPASHTDFTVPLAYNWNGLVHPGESEQPDSPAGFRSISDRGLVADRAAGSIDAGLPVGTDFIPYAFPQTPGVPDIVHLGLTGPGSPRQWDAFEDFDDMGIVPTWLDAQDQSGPQRTALTQYNIAMGPDTRVALLFHVSNGGGSFDATLEFADGTSVAVNVQAPDWYLDQPAIPPSGALEVQRQFGIFSAARNQDNAFLGAPSLNVVEAVFSTSSIAGAGMGDVTGKRLTGLTFKNPVSGVTKGFAIYAATIRDPIANTDPVPPTGTGSAVPSAPEAGRSVLLRVGVSPGQNPASTGVSVTANLASLGGSGTQAFFDDGTNGDVTPGDLVFSYAHSISSSQGLGLYQVPFAVADEQARSTNGTIEFNVIAFAWHETADGGGDAGELIAFAQVPAGSGSLGALAGDITPADVDLYAIDVCDVGSFLATTVGGAAIDTQIFLFDSAGMGITFNDDSSATTQSTITSLFVPAPGAYYLAISGYDRDPVDEALQELWLDTPFAAERSPDGPGAASPFAAWAGTAAGQGAYRINLSGACFRSDGPACDPDYNQDGNADQDDIAYLVSVVAGGENPTGRDPDFNQDGNVDQDDVAALINVVAGGDCP